MSRVLKNRFDFLLTSPTPIIYPSGYYPVEDYMRIEVSDTNPRKSRAQFSDVSQVEKFELTDEQYGKRTGK